MNIEPYLADGGRHSVGAPPDRHAFLIMAHTDPRVLRTLLTLIDDERNDIYLHLDKKSDDIDPDSIVGAVSRARIEIAEPMIVNWGGYSQIECELRLLERASRNPHAFYHLISGADLPLLHQDDFHAFFSRHAGQEFVHYVQGPLPAEVIERVTLRRLFAEMGRRDAKSVLTRLAATIEALNLQLQRKISKAPSTGSTVFLAKGAQWFSITHELARHVISQRAWIKRTFGGSRCGDEFFLQTLVLNSPFRERLAVPWDVGSKAAAARLTDWERGPGDSPYTWRMEDLPQLLTAHASGFVFARKFSSQVDAAVIDALAEHVSQNNRLNADEGA